jgi:hypothetical protein
MIKKKQTKKPSEVKQPKENQMSGPRNKNAGHEFERTIVKAMNAIGFTYASTSREQSRARDNEGVDIMNSKEYINGRLPYNLQCKNLASNTPDGKFPYAQILANMPEGEEINVICHNQTVKRISKDGKTSRFITMGQYAHLGLRDFFTILHRLEMYRKAFKILNDYFDSIPEEDKLKVQTELEALGL